MRHLRQVGVGFALGTTLFLAGCSTSHPSPTSQAICTTIDSAFYYPTVPQNGEHVSRQAAINVEALLKESMLSGLHKEAAPPQRAIASNDEAAMVRVFSYLQASVCPTVGITPAT